MSKKVVWFSAFRYIVPEDYENWLENLSSQGWIVKKIGQWSSIKMTFTKEDPKKYRYVYDINMSPKNDYKATYEQFGWELVGQMASAFIWRKEYTNERPESFTDMESLTQHNKNLQRAAFIPFLMFLLTFLIATTAFVLTFRSCTISDIVQFILGILLNLSICIYIGLVVIKISKNIIR